MRNKNTSTIQRGKGGNILRTQNPPSGAMPLLSVEGSAFAASFGIGKNFNPKAKRDIG